MKASGGCMHGEDGKEMIAIKTEINGSFLFYFFILSQNKNWAISKKHKAKTILSKCD